MVKSGIITLSRITLAANGEIASARVKKFNQVLEGTKIQDIRRFEEVLRGVDGLQSTAEVSAMSSWLDGMFGKVIE